MVIGTRARICKPFKEPRNRFPARRAGTTTHRPARLHKLAESIPWNRFLGSLNVYIYGLWYLFRVMHAVQGKSFVNTWRRAVWWCLLLEPQHAWWGCWSPSAAQSTKQCRPSPNFPNKAVAPSLGKFLQNWQIKNSVGDECSWDSRIRIQIH
jgi:hypothetical protein